MFKGLSPEERAQLLPDNLILLGYRGSIAHGTYVPQDDPDSIDDKDLLGVYVGPLERYLGFGTLGKQRWRNHEKFIGEWDVVCYEVAKFINLLLKCNPNVLSLLWLDEPHYLYVHPLGQRLIDNRGLFVSKQAYHAFNGYAYAQLRRMTHFHCDGYMGAKRKALVKQHSFDTKNAAHLIRLLKQGIEFLTEGKLYVQRPDAQQLIAIKKGEWNLEKVQQEAERLFALAEEAYVRSKLPDHPDRAKAEQLVISIIEEWHGINPKEER